MFCPELIALSFVSSQHKGKHSNLVTLVVKGIGSKKELSKNQLCAGHKIQQKRKNIFFEYSGSGRNYTFTKIAKIDSYVDKITKKVCNLETAYCI